MSLRRPGRPVVAVMYLGSNGGGPKFAFELARGLQRTGHHVVPIVSDRVDNRADFASIGPVLALPTFTTTLGAALRSPLLPFNALRIRRQLRRRRVTALVIAMEHVWHAPILAMLRGTGIPQLLCVHDASMHPGDSNAVETMLLALQRRIADGALTFSEHVAGRLQQKGTFPADRIWQTVHGAYGQPAANPHLPLSDGELPVVGFFGRIAEYKGISLCHEAVTALRASGRRIRFRVVGNGPLRLVEKLTHADDEVSVRWVDDHEIAEILRGFSVLALPYTESSQSGVFAYALSQGLPMVVTPVGGLLEQARETKAAAISTSMDPADFAAAIQNVLADDRAYAQLARSGLEASTGAHSWDRVAVDTSNAIASLAVLGPRAHGHDR